MGYHCTYFWGSGHFGSSCLARASLCLCSTSAESRRRFPTSAGHEVLQESPAKTRGGQKKRPKRKAASLEASAGMSFEGKHPEAAVNIFLFRYTGRDIIKKQDYWHICEETPHGVVCSLHVPAWRSGAIFVGRACEAPSQAEISAAEIFLEDTEVLEAAERLRPPMCVVQHHTRETKSQREDLRNSGQVQQVRKEMANQKYHGFQTKGFRTAVWDGKA